jgi:hypothetical protein
VALPFALLAKPATGLIAAHHAAQQGTRQNGGKVGDLLEELLAGSGKLSGPIFHIYKMKDITIRHAMQGKNDRTRQNCLDRWNALSEAEPASDPGDGTLQKVQNPRLAGI